MKKGIIKSKHKIAPIIGSRTRTGMIYTLCMIYTLFTFVGTNYQDWQPVHSVSTNLVHFFFLITHFPLHIPCRNLSYLRFIPNPLIPLCHPKTFHTSVSSQNLSCLCFVPKPWGRQGRNVCHTLMAPAFFSFPKLGAMVTTLCNMTHFFTVSVFVMTRWPLLFPTNVGSSKMFSFCHDATNSSLYLNLVRW